MIYDIFLDEISLIETWKKLNDAINSSDSFEIVLKNLKSKKVDNLIVFKLNMSDIKLERSEINVLSKALEWHEKGRRVCIVSVIKTWGSPRPVGAMMSINRTVCQ